MEEEQRRQKQVCPDSQLCSGLASKSPVQAATQLKRGMSLGQAATLSYSAGCQYLVKCQVLASTWSLQAHCRRMAELIGQGPSFAPICWSMLTHCFRQSHAVLGLAAAQG